MNLKTMTVGQTLLVNEHQQMTAWFKERTNMHISLVQKYLDKVILLALPEVASDILQKEKSTHDQSKFVAPEYEPYLHITWKYRQQGLGKKYTPPLETQEKMQAATFFHVKHNRHHPEFWDDTAKPDCINPQNRDAPGTMVDATSMPLSYVAIMCADWLAVSEEKKTSVQDWADKNVNIRWKFSPKQVALIQKICKAIEIS